MTKQDTVTLTLRIDPKLKEEAKIKAIRRGTTLSDLIRQTLEEFIQDCDETERCRAMVA